MDQKDSQRLTIKVTRQVLKGYEKQSKNKGLRKCFTSVLQKLFSYRTARKYNSLTTEATPGKVQSKAKRQSVEKGVSVGRMPKEECAYLKDHTFSCKVDVIYALL